MLTPSERGLTKAYVPFFRLRDFDIKVGDIVQTAHDAFFNDIRRYRVTGIHTYIFTVESLEKTYRTSFQRKEYQVGMVQRVRRADEKT